MAVVRTGDERDQDAAWLSKGDANIHFVNDGNLSCLSELKRNSISICSPNISIISSFAESPHHWEKERNAKCQIVSGIAIIYR